MQPAQPRAAALPALLTAGVVLIIYVWLVSAGTWTRWPGRWHSYDSLAAAFGHGQLWLEALPSPALLALPDPYDPAARQGIPFLQDASLYNGRYYLYFGPAPALLLIPVKALVPGILGEQYLVFAFVSGIFLLQAALAAAIRRRLFASAPAWMLAPVILAAGLANPWAWMLTTPSIYNAAVTAGQFFFLAGLLAAWLAVQEAEPSPWQMALIGVLWALALGSRINLILPVALLTGLLCVTVLLRPRAPGAGRLRVARLLPLLGFLGAGVGALAWYNWARFGSVLEFGLRYQLAGIGNAVDARELFSPIYVIQNLHAYLLTPPQLKYPFPWIFPAEATRVPVLSPLPLPGIYHTQEISGLLYSAPHLLLAFVALVTLLRRPLNRQPDAAAPAGFRWLALALALACLPTLAFFAAYYWAAERFMADFMAPLFLLALLGFWALDQRLGGRRSLRNMLRVTFAALLMLSVCTGILMAISFNTDGFRQLNPVLWRQLGNLFRP